MNLSSTDADAIVKGVATTVGTAILIVLSATLFDTPLTVVSAVACLAVFLSSYTYIKAGLKPPSVRPSGTKVVYFCRTSETHS